MLDILLGVSIFLFASGAGLLFFMIAMFGLSIILSAINKL